MSFNADSSNPRERGSPPRHYSYPPTQYPSSLTPATFPADDALERPASHDSSESQEDEDDTSSQDASLPSRNTGPDHPSPISASSVLHGGNARSPAPSEATFNPIIHHSYTFPPPAPPFYAAPSMRDWRGTEEGSSSWRSHGSREQLRPMKRRSSADEGNDKSDDIPVPSHAYEYPSNARYEPPPTIEPRFVPESPLGHVPPFTSSGHHGNDNAPVSGPPHHGKLDDEFTTKPTNLILVAGYLDPRFLRPPPYYPDSHYGRHHSAPLYSSEDWSRRASSSNLPIPGALQDGASSSKVVLPPVSHLLGSLGTLSPDNYGQGPVLPRLRLPDQAGVDNFPLREREDYGDRASPDAAISPRLQSHRKKQRTDTAQDTDVGGEGHERKTKVSRKIYVACDFCRGRKLRCDGAKPCCSNCETRSLACKYQDHPRRRGPGKAPKGTRSKKTETKGRKGKGNARQADSETQLDNIAGSSSSHFEPAAEEDRPGPYMELGGPHVPRPYSDRPSGSNPFHGGYVLDESRTYYPFTGEAFNPSREPFGLGGMSRMEGGREDSEHERVYTWLVTVVGEG
ncbi:hypothetical protein BU15DRAFT_73596 [Melanogaster broomeanus]|nr:hypothetical protein BU15DRAFT_73596 [Melanogaster broomeanus]